MLQLQCQILQIVLLENFDNKDKVTRAILNLVNLRENSRLKENDIDVGII